MKLTPLEIKSVGVAESRVWNIDHGIFPEWFKSIELLTASRTGFSIQQSSIFQSQHRIIHRIHYSLTPQILGKWVTWIQASIQDVTVNLKETSKIFSKSILKNKDSQKSFSVRTPPGLRHRFFSQHEKTLVSNSVRTQFAPSREFCIYYINEKLENDCELSKIEAKFFMLDKLFFTLVFPKLSIQLKP
jgi:dTDP-4-dehydrorhamnose 3,5-epimerase-like enzyme